MGDIKYCYGCFEPFSGEDKCPKCGYDHKSPYSPSYIVPGTVLNDRYIVGKLLSHNGEGATYLAFDPVLSCKILIREYMPDALCTRVAGSPEISVNHNSVAQYKSLMAEFTELNKKLAKLNTVNNINPVRNLFSENNTTYVVFDYIDGINLIQYLKENAGELSWRKVSRLFPPLFTSISMLHNAGIVHRGISPQTIYVTKKGELMLTDFCIAAVRTTKTELNSEIYKGYAAPEQYSPSSWQGVWTDVYGICAVLYRIFTGSMPTEASLRTEDSDLTPPLEMNDDVPANVSDAIMEGLALKGADRIQTVTELVTKIFEPSEAEKTSLYINIGEKAKQKAQHEAQESQSRPKEEYYDDDDYEDDEDYEYEAPKPSRPKSPLPQNQNSKDGSVIYASESLWEIIRKPALIFALIIVLFILLISGAIYLKKIFDKANNNPNVPHYAELTEPPETMPPDEPDDPGSITDVTNGGDVTVTLNTNITSSTENKANARKNIECKDLVGEKYDEVAISSFAQDITIVPEYVDNEEYSRGIIFDQDISAGTWMAKGDKIKVKVSNGNGDAQVPDYKRGPLSCHPIADYLALLDEAGIAYKAIPVVNTGYSSGYVIKTNPPKGSLVHSGELVEVTYTKNEGGGTVTYSAGANENTPVAKESAQAPTPAETKQDDDDDDDDDE